MSRKVFFQWLPAWVSAVILCGCAADAPAAKEVDFLDTVPTVTLKSKVPRVSSKECVLKVPYDITATAGMPLEFSVILSYEGFRQLVIKEWYMFDQYNFEIRYRRLPDDRVPDKNQPFLKYRMKIPKDPAPRRSELMLNQGNRAMLTLNFPIPGELAPGEKAIYEVYVVTALRTFRLASNRMIVRTQ